MADSLKEFYNSSSITYSDLKSGVTIETNTSTEEALLKDLKVQSLVPVKFKVNNFDILETNPSSEIQKYEGNEIIPASSSLIAYTDVEPLYNASFYTGSQSTYILSTFVPEFTDPLREPRLVSRKQLTWSPSLADFPRQCWYINGKFYFVDRYSGAQGTGAFPLYVRDGLGGTDSVAIPDVNDGAFFYDGVRYFYRAASSAAGLTRYDTQTGTTSTLNLQNTIFNVNGKVQFDVHDNMIAYMSSTTVLKLADVSDPNNIIESEARNWGTLGGGSARPRVMKNYKTNGATVYLGVGSDFMKIEFASGSSADTYSFDYLIMNIPSNEDNIYDANKVYVGTKAAYLQIAIQGYAAQTFFMSSSGQSGFVSNAWTQYGNSYFQTLANIDSVTDDQFGTAKIKASGVKTTG